MTRKIMKLLDVCDFQGGTQPPKEEWIDSPKEGYVRMLQIRDYSQGDEKFIQYVKDDSKLHKCRCDDIMLSRYGYIGQAFSGLEGAYNVALVKVIKKIDINTRYLYHYFRSYYFQHFLLSNVGARATIPGFNKSELANAIIPVPDIAEQKKIADLFDCLDSLRSTQMRGLKLFDDLVKSQFIEMFGNIPQENFVSLSEVCKIITDGTHQPPKFCDKGIPFLFVSNLANNEIDYNTEKFISRETYSELIKRTPIELGDILLSTVGSYGHPAVVTDDREFCFQRHIAYLKPKSDLIESRFLYGALLSPIGQEQIERGVKGIAQKTLNLSEIRKIRIPSVSLEQQKLYSAFYQQTDKSKDIVELEVAA